MMQSTMQDFPLNVGMIFRHGRALHGESEVVTFEGDASRRASFAEVADRVERLAVGLRALGVAARRPRRHVHVEHPGAPRGVLRGAHAGRGAAHAQHPPVPGAARVHREPRRRPGRSWSTTSSRRCWRASPPSSRRSSATSSSATATVGPRRRCARLDRVRPLRRRARRRRSRGVRLPRGRRVGGRGDVLHERHHRQPEGRRLLAPFHVHAHHRHPDRHPVCPYTWNDRLLPIVPMFHANAWGAPYAAWMAGADLLMPGRYLQAEPLAKFIASERPTTTCAVPTIWADLLRYSEDHDVDFSSLQRIMCGGAAVPRALMEAFQERFGIRMLQAWGMTETSPVAAVSLPPRGVPLGTKEEMDWRALTGPAARRGGAADRRRRRHGAAVGRRSGGGDPSAGARGSPARTTAIRPPRSSTTDGCAPATSPASRRTAT